VVIFRGGEHPGVLGCLKGGGGEVSDTYRLLY